MKSVFQLALLVFFLLASFVGADEPHAWSVDIFAGTGQSPELLQPYAPGQPTGADVALGNPFGIEVADDSIWITTVDDSCVWRCDASGKSFQRIAGNGTSGYSGDNGPAVDAQFNWPHEVRVDEFGNLFIADTRNHVIRKVDAKSGIVTTLAGSGKAGYSGDGRRGTAVQFDQPHSVVLDNRGGVLVADTKNHRIRRIDIATGVVTTVCGTGERKLPTDGADATSSPLFGPRSLAVDESSIWVVLREGNSVWRIDRKSNTVHHVAGTGKKGHGGDGGPPLDGTFNGPKGIAIDRQGRVLIVDTENHAVRRIDLPANTMTTILGNRSPSKMRLKRPHGIAATSFGFLLGDSEMHRVVQWRDHTEPSDGK